MDIICATLTEPLYDRRKAELQYELNEGANGNYLRSLVFSFIKNRPANNEFNMAIEIIIRKQIAEAIEFTLHDALYNDFLDDTKRLYTHVEFYALSLAVITLWRMGFVTFDGSEDELMNECYKVYFSTGC